MRFFVTILTLSLGLISCAHHQTPTSLAAGEKMGKSIESTIEFLPATIETALGESIFSRMLRTTKKFETSEEFKTYANGITKKIGENSHRPALNYETIILDLSDPVAVGLPGGKILISKGFLDLIKTESEFANLIANQIAHIAKQHLVHDLMMNAEYAEAFKSGNVTERIVKQSIFILFDLGFVVSMVNSADRLAPTYAMHVGYNTNGLVTLLETLKKSMEKKQTFGKADQSFDMINHRTSMNTVFAKSLETANKSGFPKAEDRFAAMIKKIKPIKNKQ
jgi:predicted Zn-dependent protease